MPKKTCAPLCEGALVSKFPSKVPWLFMQKVLVFWWEVVPHEKWSNCQYFLTFLVCVCVYPFTLAALLSFCFQGDSSTSVIWTPVNITFIKRSSCLKVRWSCNIDFLLCSYDSKQSSGHRMNPCKLTRVMYISVDVYLWKYMFLFRSGTWVFVWGWNWRPKLGHFRTPHN